MKRWKPSTRKRDRRFFTATATGTKAINTGVTYRGGVRL